MFIFYSYKCASNLFEVEFYYLYKYKRIQRKMCACVLARIKKSSFSKVFLITAKSSFSKVFWIKAVKVSKSAGYNHSLRRTISIMLLHSFIEITLPHDVSCKFVASLNCQRTIKYTQERLLPNHVFWMIEYLLSRLL